MFSKRHGAIFSNKVDFITKTQPFLSLETLLSNYNFCKLARLSFVRLIEDLIDIIKVQFKSGF